MALRRHPMVNGSWSEEKIRVHHEINIGVPVAVFASRGGGGRVVPVIRQADTKTLQQISEEIRHLSGKARRQGLPAAEMKGGTFTISNLGMYGVDHFEAIINPPQAAILAVGSARAKPVVRHGQVVPGNEMDLTVSADHRVVDGAVAAAFLATVRELLEDPEGMTT